MQFTKIDRVLSKFHRDLKGVHIDENDAIEWIGEALDFLKVRGLQEEDVVVMEVKNYHTLLPLGFHAILQIAKDNFNIEKEEVKETPTKEQTSELPNTRVGSPIPLDDNGLPLTDVKVAYYRPYVDKINNYNNWTTSVFYKKRFTPVKLSNSTFFNSLVYKEKNHKDIYKDVFDEYTIIGDIDKKIRFSFEKGIVAISYLKNRIDNETGYPLIPDNSSYITALTYYLKWKIAEWYTFIGKKGFINISKENERLWNKYARQAKNHVKMYHTIDDYQTILDRSHMLIHDNKKYYNYFSNVRRN